MTKFVETKPIRESNGFVPMTWRFWITPQVVGTLSVETRATVGSGS